jgi:hypothetical protein
VVVLPGVTDQEVVKDQRRMNLAWRNHLVRWPKEVDAKGKVEMPDARVM